MGLFRRMNRLSLRLAAMAASHPRHCRAVAVTAVVAVAAASAALVVAGVANKSAISVGARLPTAGSRHAKRRRPTAAAAAAAPAAPPLPPPPPPLLPIAATGRSENSSRRLRSAYFKEGRRPLCLQLDRSFCWGRRTAHARRDT